MKDTNEFDSLVNRCVIASDKPAAVEQHVHGVPCAVCLPDGRKKMKRRNARWRAPRFPAIVIDVVFTYHDLGTNCTLYTYD